MFERFRRNELHKKGLSCGKTRRRHEDNDFLRSLEHNTTYRVFIAIGFFLLLTALISSNATSESLFLESPQYALSTALALFLASYAQLRIAHLNLFLQNSKLLLFYGAMLLQLFILKLLIVLSPSPEGNPLSNVLLYTPFAFMPITIAILMGRAVGVILALYSSLIGSLLLQRDLALPYMVVSLATSFAGVYVTERIRKRSSLLRAGFWVGITGVLLGILGNIIQFPTDWEMGEHWSQFATQIVATLSVGIATGMIVGGLLPLLESSFQITTEMTWMELADLNHPLMKRLSVEAPGTYHHSLVLANLAEAAAETIGANPAMCRVCAYFHDIGKLAKPHYFIENIPHGENPHDELTPSMSALVIISHVKDGVDLAIKHKLHSKIIDIIEQHHGSSLVYYFYHKALKIQGEIRNKVALGKAREEDIPEVKAETFRYPGPKPETREAAIISLADAIESASRTLDKPTVARITQLVEEICTSRLQQGELDECDLTMKELKMVEQSFINTLKSMLHTRVAYPKENTAHSPPALPAPTPPADTSPLAQSAKKRPTESLHLPKGLNKTSPPEENPNVTRQIMARGGEWVPSPKPSPNQNL